MTRLKKCRQKSENFLATFCVVPRGCHWLIRIEVGENINCCALLFSGGADAFVKGCQKNANILSERYIKKIKRLCLVIFFIRIIQLSLFSSEFYLFTLPGIGKYSQLKRDNWIMWIKNITKHNFKKNSL